MNAYSGFHPNLTHFLQAYSDFPHLNMDNSSLSHLLFDLVHRALHALRALHDKTEQRLRQRLSWLPCVSTTYLGNEKKPKVPAAFGHARQKRDLVIVSEQRHFVTLSRPILRIQNGPARPENLSRQVPSLANQMNISKQNRRLSRRLSRSPSGRRLLYEKRRPINPPRRSRSIGRRRGRTGRKERTLSINPRSLKNPNSKRKITGKKQDPNGAKEKAPSPNLLQEILKR